MKRVSSSFRAYSIVKDRRHKGESTSSAKPNDHAGIVDVLVTVKTSDRDPRLLEQRLDPYPDEVNPNFEKRLGGQSGQGLCSVVLET